LLTAAVVVGVVVLVESLLLVGVVAATVAVAIGTGLFLWERLGASLGEPSVRSEVHTNPSSFSFCSRSGVILPFFLAYRCT
jgi:hypothetical protein